MSVYLNKLREIEHRYKIKFYIPGWSDSHYQERLMRFGREFKALNLESPYDADTGRAIVESFAQDLWEEASKLESLRELQGLCNRYRW